MKSVTVIAITGHPATGKTSLAKSLSRVLHLPLLDKDSIKETLADVLGWSDYAWSRKLSRATMSLLYMLSERLASSGVDHILEANFDPQYADVHWHRLVSRNPIRVIQVLSLIHI